MKKFLTQISILAVALAITASAFAQSPNATRQRRTSAEETQSVATPQPSPAATPEVIADAQTNRMDATSDEEAVVQQYNNFFTSYLLGPEDVISVNVFAQERYSKQGIVIPPVLHQRHITGYDTMVARIRQL